MFRSRLSSFLSVTLKDEIKHIQIVLHSATEQDYENKEDLTYNQTLPQPNELFMRERRHGFLSKPVVEEVKFGSCLTENDNDWQIQQVFMEHICLLSHS